MPKFDSKAHYLKNKERYNRQSESWRIKNRERYNELIRRWRKQHPEAVKLHRVQTRQYEKEHPEKVRQWRRNSYARNPERVKERNKRWLASNPEARARRDETARRWAKNNPEKVAAKAKRWRMKHREKVRQFAIADTNRRRALKRGSTINPKSIEVFVSGVRSKPTAVCYYCKRRLRSNTVHFDHIIPLSKGGAHSVENLCVSCPTCNCRKHNSLIGEWMTLGQQLLAM